MWSEPKRAAFEAEYDRSEPAPARQAPPEFYFDSTPPQTELRAQPSPVTWSEPEPQAEAGEDVPLFPERSYSNERRKGGWLGLFGGRPKAAEPQQPEPPTYRQTTAVPTSRGGAATAAATAQEPEMESAEDLDIPSFLRRLAN